MKKILENFEMKNKKTFKAQKVFEMILSVASLHDFGLNLVSVPLSLKMPDESIDDQPSQATCGFPLYNFLHTQIGISSSITQSAFAPHVILEQSVVEAKKDTVVGSHAYKPGILHLPNVVFSHNNHEHRLGIVSARWAANRVGHSLRQT